MKNQELSQTISWQRPLSFIELYGNCRKKIRLAEVLQVQR